MSWLRISRRALYRGKCRIFSERGLDRVQFDWWLHVFGVSVWPRVVHGVPIGLIITTTGPSLWVERHAWFFPLMPAIARWRGSYRHVKRCRTLEYFRARRVEEPEPNDLWDWMQSKGRA